MARVLTIFVAAMTKYLTRSNLREKRFYLGSQFEGMVNGGRGDMEAGMAATGGNKRVRWLAHSSAERRGKRTPVSLIAPFFFF